MTTRSRRLLAAATCFLGLGVQASATEYRFVRIADTRDGPYFLSPERHAAINNAGSVAFWRQHSAGGGIGYFIGNGGAYNPIILDTSAPLSGLSLHQLSLNDSGTIAFYADSFSGTFHVFKCTSAGALTVVAESGAGTFGSIDDFPVINNSGAVAFKSGSHAFVNSGAGNIEYYGPTVPATGVAVASEPFLNNSGQLSLSGSYGLAVGGFAHLRGAGEPPTIIADGATTITSFGPSSLNDGGTLIFGCTTSSGQAIFTGFGADVLTTIADSSGPYDLVALNSHAGFGAGGDPAINNSGSVAFTAKLDSGPHGIFTGADPTTTRVIQAGSTIFGRSVSSFFGGLGREAINDAGEIAFQAELSDSGGFSDVVVKAVPFSAMKWDHDGDGSWSVGGNWLGPVPNAFQHDANFTSAITAPRTITVDGAFTVGSINFDNANRYTIAGLGSITLDDSFTAQINVLSGSHEISAGLVMPRDTTITVAGGSDSLTVGNPMSASSITLTKAGSGTLRMKNYRVSTLKVDAGVAEVLTGGGTAGTSRVNILSIAGGAVLDLKDHDMIIDYSIVGTLVSDVRSHLKNGRLTTTAATPANTRLGYVDNATLSSPRTSFSGQSVDPTSLLVKFTYAGDADLDGDADGVDIGTWAVNFTGELGGAGTSTWSQGDWDYDGDVDGVDAGLWAQAFTGELGGGGLGAVVVDDPNIAPGAAAILRGLGVTVVPEPGALALLPLGASALRIRRRRMEVSK